MKNDSFIWGGGGSQPERGGHIPVLLRFLARETYTSGQEMAESLGITRAAVWKQLKTLRRLGYEIEAHPRRGYLLVSRPERLYPWEVGEGLATRFMGKYIEYYEELPSTNQRAKELLAAGPPEGVLPPEGALVLAEKQTGGRGRLGRYWFSPPGSGIWMTLLLMPGLSPVELPKLTLLAAVALSQAVFQELGLRLLVKWPNDLYLEGRKICGILTELAGEMNRVEYMLLGVGINVNQLPEDFPEELRDKAGSLRMSLGCKVNRPALLRRYLTVLEKEYTRVGKAGFEGILEYCRQYSATLGRRVEVANGKRCYRGEAIAVHDDGSLELRRDDGGTVRITAGDVVLLS